MNIRIWAQLTCVCITLILLAVIAFAQVPPPPSVAPASGDSKATTGKRGSITGRVLGEDGQPLEGATVVVMAMSGERTANRTGSTDEEGNFKLQNLPAAAYIVTATVPGLVSTQGSMLETMAGNIRPRYRIGESVTLTMVKGGAITGKILDASGQPLVGAPVWAMRVRDAEGRMSNDAVNGRPGWSDDRGVYRVYGLQAGSYVVYTMGAGETYSFVAGSREVPTYYPSATRDTAQEVSISAGLEVQSIDIRHRGELGYAVSGTIAGAVDGSGGMYSIVVELLQAGTGTRFGAANVNLASNSGFAMYGIPDGDYDIMALQRIVNLGQRVTADSMASAPRRVTVRGGDVTGLELRLTALSSIAGRVVLEKIAQPTCQITRRGELEETLLLPQREGKEGRRGTLAALMQDAAPNDKGEFVVRDLEAGRYRLYPQLPSDHWYFKALNVGAATSSRPATTRAPAPNLATTGIALKSGEKLSGVTITIAEGAAGLSGRIDGKKLPTRLRVHVVPAEPEAASDVLRYYEIATRDGAFTFTHLAPGKYWLLARAVPDDESDEKPAKPMVWDANERVTLRRAAEAANQGIELMTCQRANNFVLKFDAGVK